MKKTPIQKQNKNQKQQQNQQYFNIPSQNIIAQAARLLIIYPIVGFYAFMAPMQAYAQYIPDIDQINKVEKIVESTLPFYVFQGRTANVMMPLSVEWPITSAAWRLPEVIKNNINLDIQGQNYTLNGIYFNNGFLPERNYTGYFNPTGCYSYDTNAKMFSYTQRNDNLGACPTDQFAGGALNWAGLTVLDLARYALTGGDRVVDTSADTVLERSRVFTWENDVFQVFNPSKTLWTIAEHTKRFPIKIFDTYGINGRGASTVKYSRTCGTTLYIGTDPKQLLTHEDCAKLNMNGLERYEMRVKVCDEKDAPSRPQYCQRYPAGNYKPVGVLQNKSPTSRIGAMGYLNYGTDIVKYLETENKKPRLADNQKTVNLTTMTYADRLQYWLGERMRHLSGGVLRAPNKFLGGTYYNDKLNFAENPLMEFHPDNGIILDKGAGARLVTSNGIDSPQDGGPSVIAYTNKFGRNNYVETDDLTELTGEAMRYISNQPTQSGPVDISNQYSKIVRQPFYFKKIWQNGNDGAGTALPNQKLNAAQLNTVLPMHYDYFPVIENWNWKKTPTQNLPDEPVRTKCEAQKFPRMIMLSDVNNWHAFIGYSAGGQFNTSTHLEKENVLVNNDLRDVMNLVVNYQNPITDKYLSETQPNNELTNDPLSPRYTQPTQNRYLASAITASANLFGVKYNGGAMNKVTPQIRVKSSMIDVGEPLIQVSMNANETKLQSNGKAADCHLFYAGGLGTANSLGDFVNQFGGDACQRFLNALDDNKINEMEQTMPPGYFYPSNPQKLINNIRQAFEIPFEISGNLQVGEIGTPDANNTSVPLYQFHLDVLQNKREQTSHLRSLPKKFTVKQAANGATVTEEPIWANNLYNSMRQYKNRTVFVGQEKLDDKVAKDSSYTNFDILTNAATEFAGSSSNSREKMTELLINYLRGDDSNEGESGTNGGASATPKNGIFRTRSIDGEANSLIGSTQTSNPIVMPKTTSNGAELVYITGNDGMLHAINAETGQIRFSYIPQALAGKISQTAMEGYQNANLFESFLAGQKEKAYSNNQEVRVVAGGFGLGQKGVFALDVTNIQADKTQPFTKDNAMFEFTDQDDEDVGNIIGQPEILTFETPQSNGTSKRQSYLAFTSGHKYDNRSGRYPHLFLLKISNNTSDLGRGIDKNRGWVKGKDYFKIKITDPINGFNNPDDNGFTAPKSFSSNQKIVATYFGDLYGNLWKVMNLDKVVKKTGSAKVVRLYQGVNGGTNANWDQLQAITAKPNLAISKQGGILITFGTGRLLGINDLGTKHHTPQGLIAVRDNDLDSANPKNLKLITADDLAQHTITSSTSIMEGAEKNQGWRVTFPDQNQGMRMVTTPQIINGVVNFSMQSTGDFSINDCGANAGGFGVVNLETGKKDDNNPNVFTRYNRVIGEILILPPLEDDDLDNYNAIGSTGTGVSISQTAVRTNLLLGSATANNVVTNPLTKGVNGVPRSGIISWREIQDNN